MSATGKPSATSAPFWYRRVRAGHFVGVDSLTAAAAAATGSLPRKGTRPAALMSSTSLPDLNDDPSAYPVPGATGPFAREPGRPPARGQARARRLIRQ